MLGELTLVGVFSGEELYYRYPHGDEVYNVVVAYQGAASGGELRVDRTEGRALRYFALGALPAPLSPPDVPVIEAFKSIGR